MMDRLPAEILHSIFALLTPEEARAIRLVNRKLSAVGIYYVISRISFFLATESLERLHQIALHPILSQQVTCLHYQANVLEEIKSPKVYREHMNHMNASTCRQTRPESPPPGASIREWRLFSRNERKWRRGNGDALSTRQVSHRIETYNEICAQQQEVIKNGVDKSILADSISRFPNLRRMVFAARPTCCHTYSELFMERFADLGITPPTKPDTSLSPRQLSDYLTPLASTKVKLGSLSISFVSPELLQLPALSLQLISLKQNLSSIVDCALTFKLDADKTERLHEHGGSACFGILKDGGLPLFLSHMPKLQNLVVLFEDCPCSTKISLNDIVGDHEWPDLQAVSFGQFSATEESLMRFLFCHSKSLRRVRFRNAFLAEGSWIVVTEEMRSDLKLDQAWFTETIRGTTPEEHWDMRKFNLDAEPYQDITLSDDLNHYICNYSEDDEDMDFEPVHGHGHDHHNHEDSDIDDDDDDEDSIISNSLSGDINPLLNYEAYHPEYDPFGDDDNLTLAMANGEPTPI